MRTGVTLLGYPTADGYTPIACQTSAIVFDLADDLFVSSGVAKVFSVGSYVFDGSYTVTCGDATSLSGNLSSVTRASGTCDFTVTSNASVQGDASFSVAFTSSGGDTLSGTVSFKIFRLLLASGCTDGSFVDTTANPRVTGANNDLVEDCQALVAAQISWAGAADNFAISDSHPIRTWGYDLSLIHI